MLPRSVNCISRIRAGLVQAFCGSGLPFFLLSLEGNKTYQFFCKEPHIIKKTKQKYKRRETRVFTKFMAGTVHHLRHYATIFQVLRLLQKSLFKYCVRIQFERRKRSYYYNPVFLHTSRTFLPKK